MPTALDELNELYEIRPLTSLEFAVWWCTDRVAAEKAAVELAALRARIAELERIEKIARQIFEVVSTSYDARKAKVCPHGNYAVPPYNHAWFCDDCWNEMKDALRGDE